MMEESPKRIYFFGRELELPAVLEPALTSRGTSITSFSQPGDCLQKLSDRPCDLFIIDLDGCESEGLEMLTEVRRMAPWVPTLALVPRAGVRSAVRAVKAGADDCLEKPVPGDRLIEVVEAQLGQIPPPASGSRKVLTPMEIQVLQRILTGKTSQDISDELHRSKRTVDVHRKNIMRKLDACSLVDLIRRALRMGFIDSRE